MDVIKKSLIDSPTLLHIAALPVLIIFTWVFGTFAVWGTVVVVYLLFLARQAQKRKITIDDYLDTVNHDRATEHCEWLNILIRKYWVTSMPRLLQPIIANLQVTLRENKPGFLHSLHIGKWHPGVRPPRFEVIYPNLELGEDHHQFDVLLNWAADLFITIVMVTPTRQSVDIRIDGIKFKGMVRLNFKFHALFPSSGVIGVSFVDDPRIEFNCKPVGGLNILDTPMIKNWLDDIIKASIKPILQWPQELTFTMGGGAPDLVADHQEPIVDIGLVWADELSVPSGWIVVSKASCGSVPANLNSGSTDKAPKELYLCYRRQKKGAAERKEELAKKKAEAAEKKAAEAKKTEEKASTSGSTEEDEGPPLPEPIRYSMYTIAKPLEAADAEGLKKYAVEHQLQQALESAEIHKELPTNSLMAVLRATQIPGTAVQRIDMERLPDSGQLSMEQLVKAATPAPVEETEEVEEEEELEPITGIALVFPSKGEGCPAGFEQIKYTVNTLDAVSASAANSANMNVGTKAPPCYLAVSREKVAPPITGIHVLNKRTATDPPLNYVALELTPHGRSGDINQGEADELLLAVRGGAKSILGHATGTKERGLLRVHVHEARQMKAADVGGTSDPYAVVEIVGSKKQYKTPVVEKVLNPKWDSVFVMSASRNDVLQLYTYDKDAIGKDDYLGGIHLDLNTLRAGEEVISWYPLFGEDRGEVKIGVCAVDFGLLPGEAGYEYRGPLPVSERSDEIDPKRSPFEERQRRMATGIPTNRVEYKILHTLADLEEDEDLDEVGSDVDLAQSAKKKLGSAMTKISMLKRMESMTKSQPVEKQGVLKMVDDSLLSASPFGKKKDMFYALDAQRFVQYKNEKAHAEGKSSDAILLMGAVLDVDEHKGYRFTLKDSTGKKKWTFQCSEADFQSWIDSIRGNIAAIAEKRRL